MILSSSQNAIYKKLLSLTTSKGIREHNLALLSGEKICEERLRQDSAPESFWVSSEHHPSPTPALRQSVILEKTLFQALDIFGSGKPLLCVPTPKAHPMSALAPEISTLYCGLGDPKNLGAVLRSAKAFGLSQIVLLQEAAQPFLPQSLRASSGYALDFDFFSGPSIHNLPSENIVALDMEGTPIQKFPFAKTLKLIVGEEGQGLPKSFAGRRIAIPMQNQVESLNAAVSVSVLLYEWQRQQLLQESL